MFNALGQGLGPLGKVLIVLSPAAQDEHVITILDEITRLTQRPPSPSAEWLSKIKTAVAVIIEIPVRMVQVKGRVQTCVCNEGVRQYSLT
jgi:hypothetical protein